MLFIFVPRSGTTTEKTILVRNFKIMNFKSLLAIASALCFALVSFGCGGAATNNAAANNAKPAHTTAANTTSTANTSNTTTSNTTASNTTASAGDSIGVPECDEYIRKYEACLTKVAAKNPQAEAAMKQGFDAARAGWKASAANPQAKAALGPACKQAMDAVKTSMAPYACEW